MFQFDATQVAPDQGALGPVPAGWYKATIASTEIKPTKAGDGLVLTIMFDVAEGQLRGRKIFGRYNIDNPSAQTVEIARGQISAICHATGLLQFQDPNQLKGAPLQLRVTVRESEGFEPQNDIKAYKSMSEAIDGEFPGLSAGSGQFAPPAGAPQAPQQPAPQQPAPQTMAPAPAPQPMAQQPAPAPQAEPNPQYAQQAWQQPAPQQQQPAPQPAPVQQPAPQQQPPAATDVPPWMQQTQ